MHSGPIEAVAETVQGVLGLPALPDPQTGFFDLGMDSLMAVELRTRLNRLLGSKQGCPIPWPLIIQVLIS